MVTGCQSLLKSGHSVNVFQLSADEKGCGSLRIHALGGPLTIHSAPGKGAQVAVSVPLHPPSDSSSSKRAPPCSLRARIPREDAHPCRQWPPGSLFGCDRQPVVVKIQPWNRRISKPIFLLELLNLRVFAPFSSTCLACSSL